MLHGSRLELTSAWPVASHKTATPHYSPKLCLTRSHWGEIVPRIPETLFALLLLFPLHLTSAGRVHNFARSASALFYKSRSFQLRAPRTFELHTPPKCQFNPAGKSLWTTAPSKPTFLASQAPLFQTKPPTSTPTDQIHITLHYKVSDHGRSD